jgi:UrcA family protein
MDNYTTAKSALLSTISIVCTLLAGQVAAEDQPITVAIQVSTHGLDLSNQGDASAVYRSLQQAAHEVCRHGNRVGLEPLPNPGRCTEQALGEAIRAAKVPLLTQLYLASHTVQEATARGIDVPAQVAAVPSSSMSRADSP